MRCYACTASRSSGSPACLQSRGHPGHKRRSPLRGGGLWCGLRNLAASAAGQEGAFGSEPIGAVFADCERAQAATGELNGAAQELEQTERPPSGSSGAHVTGTRAVGRLVQATAATTSVRRKSSPLNRSGAWTTVARA
jgi:hypothetical protein